MAKLDTYSAKIGDGSQLGGRRATPDDFGTQLPSADFVNKAITAHIQDTEEDESRKALVASTGIHAKYAKALDEAALNGQPLDPIKEKMQQEFSTVSEQFQTKKGIDAATIYGSRAEIMFDNESNKIAVMRAESNARIEGSKFLNNESAVIARSPSYLPIAEKNAEAFAETYKGKARPEVIAQIVDEYKKQFNHTAVLTAIHQSLNPDDVRKQLEAGDWNLSPAQRLEAIGKVKEEERGRRVESEFKRHEMERAEQEKVSLARSGWFDKIMSGKATWPQIRDDPAFAGPQGTIAKEHLMTVMRAEARRGEGGSGERRSDEALKSQILLNILAPEGTPGKIYNVNPIFDALKLHTEGKGGLNVPDTLMAMGLVQRQKDENGVALNTRVHDFTTTFGRSLQANPIVKGLSAGNPNLVPEIQNEYAQRILTRSNELRKENKNPAAVLDPNSPDYMGPGKFTQDLTKEIIARSQQRVMDSRINEPVKFPDGVERVWDGKGAKTDMRSWAAVGGSTSTPQAGNQFNAWMRATGGRLKPGQTQEQAIQEWAAGK